MELHEFITETLVQINKGIIKAQQEVKGTGFYINPEGFHTGEQVKKGYNREYRHVQKIKMSIIITVDESKESKAKIGVFSSILAAGTLKKDGDSSSVTNRIEFEIPISIPVMDVKD